MKVLVIIPAHNEEDNIVDLIRKLRLYPVDVVVINDFSSDKTSEICYREKVNVIDLPCNLGIGGAVQTGYKYAFKNGYDIAIQVDGDGQHKPEFIERLIAPLHGGLADMVIGSRYIDKDGFQSTALRRVGIKYFSLLIRMFTKQKITDPTSGFRACNARIIRIFAHRYPTDYPEPESVVHLIRNKLRILEIPVIMQERQSGVSSIKSLRSVYYMIKVSLAIVIDVLREANSMR